MIKIYSFTSKLFKVSLFLAFFAIFFTLIYSHKVHAASYTWDGGGVDNNWSTCANWSTDVCPVAGDILTFNATSTKNSDVDSGFGGVVASISINSGYTGTITLQRSLQTTSTFAQSAGFFTAANQTLDIDGAFTLSSGSNFTASSGTTSYAAGFSTAAGSTFNHNSGNIIFDGSSATLICTGAVFNSVTISNTGSKTVASSCSLPLGNNPTITNSLSLSGTLSGTGTLTHTTNIFTMNSGSTLSGFTGLNVSTFTFNGGNFGSLTSLVSSTAITIASTFNANAFTTFDLNGNFTMSSASGNFTAPALMTVQGNFTVSNGTFNHNSGTVEFDGVNGSILSCNSITFNLVRFTHITNSKTVNSNCNLPLGNNPTLTSNGSITLNGTLSGTGTLTKSSGTITINSGGALSGLSGLSVTNLSITGGTVNLGSYTTFIASSTVLLTSGSLTLPNGADLNSGLTISGGTFNAPSGNMFLQGDINISGSPTFNHNSGTITLDGGIATSTCNNVTFNLIVINNTNTKTIGPNCNFPLGNNPIVPTNVLVNGGSVSGTGTLTVSTNFIQFNGATSNISGFSGINARVNISGSNINLSSYTTAVFPQFTISSGTISLPNGADFDGAVTISGGTVNASSGNITFSSSLTVTGSPTFNHNNGIVIFDGASSTISCGTITFYIVQIANTSGTKTFNSNCSTIPLGNNPTITGGGDVNISGTISGTGTLTKTSGLLMLSSGSSFSGFSALDLYELWLLGGNINLSGYTNVDITNYFQNAGTFTASENTMNISGNFIILSGSFIHNNGTVVLDGTLQTIVIPSFAEDWNFYNLTKVITSADTLTISSGSRIIVENTLNFQGDNGELLALISSSSGTQWEIDPRGSVLASYLDIQDGNNISAVISLHGTSVDSGNNIGFNFYDPTVSNLGPVANLNGSIISDNTPNFTFDLSDLDTTTIDTVSYTIQIDNNSDFSTPLVDFVSGFLSQGSFNFTSPISLPDGSYYLRIKVVDDKGAESTWLIANSGNVAFIVNTYVPPVIAPVVIPIVYATLPPTAGNTEVEVEELVLEDQIIEEEPTIPVEPPQTTVQNTIDNKRDGNVLANIFNNFRVETLAPISVALTTAIIASFIYQGGIQGLGVLIGTLVRKRKKYWGIVYNSKSFDIIPLATILITDASGNVVGKDVSDLDGKYGILLDKTGTYIIEVKASGFMPKIFEINISDQRQIILDTSLDPIQEDTLKNMSINFIKYSRKEGLSLAVKLMAFFTFIGFIYTLYVTYHYPYIINFLLLLIYFLIFMVNFVYYFIDENLKKSGLILSEDNLPIFGAVVRIFDSQGQMKDVKISNIAGEVRLRVEKGNYPALITATNFSPLNTTLSIYKNGSFDAIYLSKTLGTAKFQLGN